MLVSPVRRPPLGAQLLDQLRAMIVRGELKPGTHLVEGWIADTFGVSRGPVRDALRQLDIEGLVETRRRGAFVRGLTDVDLVELYSLRAALESAAIRDTIAALPGGDWAPIRETVARMRTAAGNADPAAFAAADLDFHSCFYELGGNRRLAAAWATHRPLFAAMLDVTNTHDRDLNPTANDHDELLALVSSGAQDAALDALTAHLAGSRDRMRAALAHT